MKLLSSSDVLSLYVETIRSKSKDPLIQSIWLTTTQQHRLTRTACKFMPHTYDFKYAIIASLHKIPAHKEKTGDIFKDGDRRMIDDVGITYEKWKRTHQIKLGAGLQKRTKGFLSKSSTSNSSDSSTSMSWTVNLSNDSGSYRNRLLMNRSIMSFSFSTLFSFGSFSFDSKGNKRKTNVLLKWPMDVVEPQGDFIRGGIQEETEEESDDNIGFHDSGEKSYKPFSEDFLPKSLFDPSNEDDIVVRDQETGDITLRIPSHSTPTEPTRPDDFQQISEELVRNREDSLLRSDISNISLSSRTDRRSDRLMGDISYDQTISEHAPTDIIEIMGGDTKGFIQPNDSDVLLGKGESIFFHSGNVYYRDLIDKYKATYAGYGNQFKKKRQLTLQIVSEVYGLGGRFLERNRMKTWEVVSTERARLKCSMSFRDALRNRKNPRRT